MNQPDPTDGKIIQWAQGTSTSGPRKDELLHKWESLKASLPIGSSVKGVVVSRPPFGAFLDIGVGVDFLALLLIPEIAGMSPEEYQAGDWCPLGSEVSATVIAFNDRNYQVSLTQRHMPTLEQLADRYRKQSLFAPLGEIGQSRIQKGRALIVGCGALGSVIAETLVRAGVGFVRIVDRDFVELSNLQRQVLFNEKDVRDRLPKAIAASRKLAAINSNVRLDPRVADLRADNVRQLMEGIDVILDGTDNFETRLLINDASLEFGIPWVNGGCVGSHGQVMTIIPGQTPCFRCLVEDVPEPGSSETCDTAGVIGPAVNIVASLQCVDALKLLCGKANEIAQVLTIIDVWDGTFRRLKIGDLQSKGHCPACQKGERAWLRGERSSQTAILCGRNAVQISPAERREIDLKDAAARLSQHGEVLENPYLVRVKLREPVCEITLFRDGRAIVQGTEDAGVARSLYARYVGA